jgi:hypothetical protein
MNHRIQFLHPRPSARYYLKDLVERCVSEHQRLDVEEKRNGNYECF